MAKAARRLLFPAITASTLVHGCAIAALAMASLPTTPPARSPAFHTVTLAFVHPPLPQPQAPADPVAMAAPARTAAKSAIKPVVKTVPKTIQRPEPTSVPAPAPDVTPSAASPAASESPSSTISTPSVTNTADTTPRPLPVVLNPDYLSPPVPPHYPPVARRLQIEGTVVVRALVERPGHPSEVTLWRSSGENLLDRSALEAVRGWRFRPMTQAGDTVAAWVEIPVTFSISNS
ncbi:MAG: TonB family protein [Magnetospirillum sp.]|nr:TonB family protein [Magnetospirillum sp.]